MTLGRNLEAREVVHLPDDTPPILLVVIDTEEEFDWESDFDRHSTAVTAAEHIPRCLLYTSPSPRDGLLSRMPSSA